MDGNATPCSLAISVARRCAGSAGFANRRLQSKAVDHAHVKIKIGADMDDIEDVAVCPASVAQFSGRPLRACCSASVLRIDALKQPMLFVERNYLHRKKLLVRTAGF